MHAQGPLVPSASSPTSSILRQNPTSSLLSEIWSIDNHCIQPCDIREARNEAATPGPVCLPLPGLRIAIRTLAAADPDSWTRPVRPEKNLILWAKHLHEGYPDPNHVREASEGRSRAQIILSLCGTPESIRRVGRAHQGICDPSRTKGVAHRCQAIQPMQPFRCIDDGHSTLLPLN